MRSRWERARKAGRLQPVAPAVRLSALAALVGLAIWLAAPAAWAAPAEACTSCHREEQRFALFHNPAQIGCTSCHGGVAQATQEEAAHASMEAYPGRTATVERTCGHGSCHAALLPTLRNSVMTTLNGMIELTRNELGSPPQAGRGLLPAQRLAEHGVDSYLRKLCVSCHLANERRHHGQSVLDRGGGCSACHLETHDHPAGLPRVAPGQAGGVPGMGEGAPPRQQAAAADGRRIRTGVHPTLTVRISNDRCFGCHSRSGRISLSYVGLAEVDAADPARPEAFGRLADGRLVEKRTPDLHSEAGLSCIDCHTGTGAMGTGAETTRQREQIDVRCEDCHAPTLTEKPITALTRREFMYPVMYRWSNPDLARGKIVATARHGTPLWHVRREDGGRILRKKVFGTEVAVPAMKAGRHHDLKGHERLTCSACHDTWAPQCDGCHISYDPAGRQWDHLRQEETPGRWIEKRWHVRNEAPALGVTAENRIAPFVPGMSLLADLPGQPQRLQRSTYARLTPHTTRAKGRDCGSCHRSERAMGVITGTAVAPWDASLRLPIGWVAKDAKVPASALHAGDRSLNAAERARVRRVGECLGCHAGGSSVYDDMGRSMAAIAGQNPHPRPGTTAPAP